MFASLEACIFQAAAEDVRLRLIAQLIAAFGGRTSRASRSSSLIARLGDPAFEAATLGDASVARHAGEIRIIREPGRRHCPNSSSPRANLRCGTGGSASRRRLSLARPLLSARSARLRCGAAPAFGNIAAFPPALAAATLPSFWHNEALLTVPQLSACPVRLLRGPRATANSVRPNFMVGANSCLVIGVYHS
jgi:hypothetical protein